ALYPVRIAAHSALCRSARLRRAVRARRRQNRRSFVRRLHPCRSRRVDDGRGSHGERRQSQLPRTERPRQGVSCESARGRGQRHCGQDRRTGRARMTSNTQVGPGTVVRLAYEVFDADGDRVDGSEPGAPIEFVFGYGTLLLAIERAIDGLSVGDQLSLRLRPDEAYGRRDSRAVLELDRDEFPDGIDPGDRFELENESGGLLVLKVLDVDDD